MENRSGEETKQKIINVAKKNFYNYGYNKAIMQRIADETGIALGSMAYYFKKKEDIASFILQDYINKIVKYINENINKQISTFTRHAIINIPYYKNIIQDDNTKRFYYELLDSGAPHTSIHTEDNIFKKNVDIFNQRILNESHINYDELYKNISSQYSIAGRNALILMLLEGDFNDVSIEYVVNFITQSLGRIFNVPSSQIDFALNEALIFNNENDMSHINLLK